MIDLPEERNSNSTTSLLARIQEMVQGFQVAQSIFAATKLGIPDLLANGQKSCEELAAATNTDSDALYRLLKALAAIEIVSEIQPKFFELSPLGTCLLNKHGSMRNYVLTQEKIGYACWGELIHSLRTGKSSFEHIYGMKRIEYFRQNPDLGQLWDGLNADLSTIHNGAILAAYDFSFAKKIVDIGGGEGSLLAAILQEYSTVKGVLLEQQGPIEKAGDLLTREGVRERCELVVGDFCEYIPPEADIYLAKNVVETLEEPIGIKLLENCYKTMTKEAKLLIIERVIGDTCWTDNFANLNSLVLSSGKMCTENELRQLFETTGFKIVKIIPTDSAASIIESIPNK